MILLIDNYDSFVHNLARYVRHLGWETRVLRNDAITLGEIIEDMPSGIILSPGPCTPAESGVCMDIIRHLGPRLPILGVCLGHQCIGEIYGGQTIRAPEPVHGDTSMIEHNGEGLFMGLPNPLEGARYHSLIAQMNADTELEITAQTEDRIPMAFAHKTHPVYGVQFHPESILTESGLDIMRNFLMLTDMWGAEKEARRI